MAFKKSAPPESKVVKISPYSIPENAMRLMCEIIGAERENKIHLFDNPVLDVWFGKEDDEKGLECFLKEYDVDVKPFGEQIVHLRALLETEQDKSTISIAVAGGFSSGKSSFLNTLTEMGNMLPTGVDPVSVVCTYLICSAKAKKMTVKGQNKDKGTILLPKEVLDAIQHSNESNVYLARVLKKLFVTVPSKKFDNVVFIDTPGYNNSNIKNKSNNATDESTAMEGAKDAQVIIWLIGGEKGAISREDIQMLKEIDGGEKKKKLIVFNKADKMSDCTSVVDTAWKTLQGQFDKDEILDVMAYSSPQERVYYSLNGNYSMPELIQKIANQSNVDEVENTKKILRELCEDCINDWDEEIEELKEEHNEALNKINEYRKLSAECEETAEEWKGYVKEVVGSYAELAESRGNLVEIAGNALYYWKDFNKNVKSFIKGIPFGLGVGGLEIDHSLSEEFANDETKNYNVEANRDIEIQDVSWLNDGFINMVNSYIDSTPEKIRNIYENIEKAETEARDQLNSLINKKEAMSKWCKEFMSAIDAGIKAYRNAPTVENVYTQEAEKLDVFEEIENGDYNRFVRSFADGVDVMKCNKDGFSPLTLASEYGQNDMVVFLLKQGVSPRWKDKRGYNAFHTAVENHFKDICEILLEYDEGVAEELTADGEDIDALAQKKPFEKWLNEKLDR